MRKELLRAVAWSTLSLIVGTQLLFVAAQNNFKLRHTIEMEIGVLSIMFAVSALAIARFSKRLDYAASGGWPLSMGIVYLTDSHSFSLWQALLLSSGIWMVAMSLVWLLWRDPPRIEVD